MNKLITIVAFGMAIASFAYSEEGNNRKRILDALDSQDSLIIYPLFYLKAKESNWPNDSNVINKCKITFQGYCILESILIKDKFTKDILKQLFNYNSSEIKANIKIKTYPFADVGFHMVKNKKAMDVLLFFSQNYASMIISDSVNIIKIKPESNAILEDLFEKYGIAFKFNSIISEINNKKVNQFIVK